MALADHPDGGLAALCLCCGTVKSSVSAPCTSCGAKSSGDSDIDSLFCEEWLHRVSLESLGGILIRLLEAEVERGTCYWTLAYFVTRDIPSSFLPLQIPERIRKRVERLITDLALPDVRVQQSHRLMPQDWDDHEAWDRYYSFWNPDQPLGSGEDGMHLLWFKDWIERLKSRNIRRVWLPGCGLDRLPWAYAAAGFEVVATDASKVAIGIQRSNEFRQYVRKRLQRRETAIFQRLDHADTLKLRFAAHDFRKPLEEAAFDCVINIQAFQALAPASMASAARTYWTALRPGGIAYFSMLNADHETACKVEQALSDVGFYIPFQKVQRRYRDGVHRLGLGGTHYDAESGWELASDPRKGWIRNMTVPWKNRRLRQLRHTYREEKEAEQATVDRIRRDGATKIAELIYNTG